LPTALFVPTKCRQRHTVRIGGFFLRNPKRKPRKADTLAGGEPIIFTSHVGSPCLEYTKAECAQFFAIVDLGHDAPRHDALWQVPARRFRGASGRI
jgi:hypothetical protein